MTLERDLRGSGGDTTTDGLAGGSPGKRTRSEGLPVQRLAADAPAMSSAGVSEAPAEDPFSVHLDAADKPVQRKITTPTALQRKEGDGAAEAAAPVAAGKDAPVA